MQGPVEDVGEAAEEEQEYGAQEDAVEPRARALGAARHPDEERKPGHAGHAGQGQQPRDASHVVPWAGGQAHALAQQAAGVGGQQHGRRGQGPDRSPSFFWALECLLLYSGEYFLSLKWKKDTRFLATACYDNFTKKKRKHSFGYCFSVCFFGESFLLRIWAHG